jgi:hypothetical protein
MATALSLVEVIGMIHHPSQPSRFPNADFQPQMAPNPPPYSWSSLSAKPNPQNVWGPPTSWPMMKQEKDKIGFESIHSMCDNFCQQLQFE